MHQNGYTICAEGNVEYFKSEAKQSRARNSPTRAPSCIWRGHKGLRRSHRVRVPQTQTHNGMGEQGPCAATSIAGGSDVVIAG